MIQIYLEDARKSVMKIIDKNPKLKNNEGENLKNLLYLFERDIAIKNINGRIMEIIRLQKGYSF